MTAIDRLDINLNNELFSKIDYEDGNDKFFQDNSLVHNIGCRGQGNRNP